MCYKGQDTPSDAGNQTLPASAGALFRKPHGCITREGAQWRESVAVSLGDEPGELGVAMGLLYDAYRSGDGTARVSVALTLDDWNRWRRGVMMLSEAVSMRSTVCRDES